MRSFYHATLALFCRPEPEPEPEPQQVSPDDEAGGAGEPEAITNGEKEHEESPRGAAAEGKKGGHDLGVKTARKPTSGNKTWVVPCECGPGWPVSVSRLAWVCSDGCFHQMHVPISCL